MKRPSFPLFGTLAASAALLLSLNSCSRKASGPAALRVWHVGSEEEAQIISRLAAERFTPESKIAVECESLAWSEAHSKYLTAMAGDVTPDVGTMGLTWGTEFGAKGQMADLRKDFPADLEDIKKNVFPSIWEATEYHNAVYAVPFDMTLQVMYYRSDVIAHPPKTWTELTQVLEKLNKDGKNMIIDWGSLDWIGFSPFLWESGGSYYNADRTKSALDGPEAVRALTFFADLYNKYQVPKSGVSIAQGFRSGQSPLGISGHWLINSLPADAPELNGKWSIALLPAGPTGKHTAFIGGRSIGIFSGSKMRKEAWAFIQFLSREDVQSAIYEEVAKSHNIYMPPNVKAWNRLSISPEFKSVLLAQARDAKAPPPVLGWNDSTRFVVESIQKVILEGDDPARALARAAAAMNERIEKVPEANGK
jgi:ABC-type glycerol-3-phosphate transport system substrate-binding protein